MTAYLHRQGISVIPYLDDWLIHHPDRQVLLRHQALLLDTLDLVGFILNRKKSELDLTLGRLHLRPLQRHFHSLGLTDRFTPPRRSDPLVLANLLRRWLDPHFLTSGIPIRPFQADFTIFTDASNQDWGAHMGDSKISGTWTLAERKLHINCLEFKAVTFALSIGLLCFRAARSWSPRTIRQWFRISTSREVLAPPPCCA